MSGSPISFTKIAILCVILIISLALFYGPLIPFSPIKVGYSVTGSTKATVFIKKEVVLPQFYAQMDSILSDAEKLYSLSYKHKVQVLVAQEYDELRRYIPWMNYQSLGGVSLQIGNMVYINGKKIKEKGYNEEEYVKHEVVHQLISQNSERLNNIEFEKKQWLSEGIALYFGGPYFYTDEEFASAFATKNIRFSELSPTLYSNLDPQDPKFNYALWGRFIQYLYEVEGKEKFQKFLKLQIENPKIFQINFEESYHKPMEDIVKGFEKRYGK